MAEYYRQLDDGTVEPCTFLEWAEDYQKERHVAIYTVQGECGTYEISTVFLGLNHQFGEGPPLIYETMIFSQDQVLPLDNWCQRYSTLQQARDGHAFAVKLAAFFAESKKMKAPFTPDQIASLNAYQKSNSIHPFICGNCGTDLVAEENGWKCHNPDCIGWQQDWCHDFMGNWEWKKYDLWTNLQENRDE